MARRAGQLGAPLALASWGALALVLALSLGTLGAVAWRAEGVGLARGTGGIIWFTLWQAAVSAGLSVLCAVPVARALARRRFWGRDMLVTLMGAPFILPVIVAILGLLAVFGRGGLLNGLLGIFGMEPVSVYGIQGILLAHVFFNLPLATRLLLQGWYAIPGEHVRLAASLDFPPQAILTRLEWPMLREVVPGAFTVIFVICTTSFAVALALGGGPRSTTVELAIYQAFRFDFNLGQAALLGLIQFGICAAAAVVAGLVQVPQFQGRGLDRPLALPVIRGWRRPLDALAITLAALFLLLPLAMVALRGLSGLGDLSFDVWAAAGRSTIMAIASALVCLMLALPLALLSTRPRIGRAVQVAGFLTVAASPLVMGTGLFILIFPLADPVALALPLTALVNAAMALPFALRALTPALAQAEQRFGPLAASLGLSGFARLRLVVIPRLRRELGFAGGLAAALAMGDLGVVALFADPNRATLPLQMYRLMSAYRMDQAMGAALLLLALSLGLFWIFDRGGRGHADA